MGYQDYLNTVQKYYIAYYQRPADPQGLRYWAEKLDEAGGAVDEIIEAFANSEESHSLYGEITSENIENVITAIYHAAFNRDPDPVGLQFYIDGFNKGKFTPATIMVNIIDGATGEDFNTIQNKMESAEYFTEIIDPNLDKDPGNDYATYAGNVDAQAARNWLAEVKDVPKKATEIYEFVKTHIADTSDKIFTTTNPADTSSDIFDYIRENSILKEYSASSEDITVTDGNDYIDAGAGNDKVDGHAGHDVIMGNVGNDTLYGGYGRDHLEGGYGADTLYAGSSDYWGDYKSEYISGHYNENNEWVRGYTQYTVDVWSEDLDGGGGADKIYGGYGSDVLKGGDGDDYIVGDNDYFCYSEDDVVKFTNGDDFDESIMYNDKIYGGDGDDDIYGKYGDDYIEGGSGNDYIDGGDGIDTIIAGDGNDTVYAEGGDNVDLGNGDDNLNYTRVDGEHGVIITGEGKDNIWVNVEYDSNGEGVVTIDLEEQTPTQDIIYLDLYPEPLVPIEIKNFDLTKDKLGLDWFDLYGTGGSSVSSAQVWSYDGTKLLHNYVQIVNSPSTEWQLKSEDWCWNDNPDDDGKGIFVIQGASVSSPDKYVVAEFLDKYGNNATYGKEDTHYFIVNIENTGMGIYKFTDDTGADNYINGDELTPVAILVGVYTEDIDIMTSANFII